LIRPLKQTRPVTVVLVQCAQERDHFAEKRSLHCCTACIKDWFCDFFTGIDILDFRDLDPRLAR
jgi:hypothetical protein